MPHRSSRDGGPTEQDVLAKRGWNLSFRVTPQIRNSLGLGDSIHLTTSKFYLELLVLGHF